MKSYRYKFLIMIAGLFILATGCHSSKGTSGPQVSRGAPGPSPAQVPAAPSILPGQLGGANSFVPYADKPPLGTPVETH